jgi:hypothetical protein
MKKLAILVEGQTEQLFVDKLITEIAGNNSLVIESHQITSGGRSIYKWIRFAPPRAGQGLGYFVLIVDCSGDSTVKSDIRDNYESLVSNGYNAVIGIRDVYPRFKYTDVRATVGLNYG